jgi:hypothetical protein
MDKLFYALTAPRGSSLDEFSDALRTEIGPTLARALDVGSRVRVRIRDVASSEHFGPLFAHVPCQDREIPLDAVVDIAVPDEVACLDHVHATLTETTSTCQGWRVVATPYADHVPDPEPGLPSDYIGGAVFIQRVDGMSRDRFSIEWHIHGVHEVARAKAQQRTMGRYIQNRVVEPVTSTFWVIDGYEEGAVPAEAAAARTSAPVPTTTERSFEEVAAGPGETEFFRMPLVRLFYGTEFLVAP